MINLVDCLWRLSNLSRDEFQSYWRETHGPLVRERAQTMGIRATSRSTRWIAP